MKKILIPILIFILMFNFIFYNISFGSEKQGYNPSQDSVERADKKGTIINPGDSEEPPPDTISTSGAIVGIFAAMLDSIPMLFNIFMNFMANQSGFINFNTTLPNIDKEDFNYMTVEKIIFGHYYLFNIDMFGDSESLLVTNKEGNRNTNDLTETLDELRNQVAVWYNIMRLVSLVLGMLTLIYIGIRMAISTVAEEQARYKKMLIGWVQSIVIIVILPYIMVLINFAGKVLMNIIDAIKTALDGKSFEKEIIDSIYGELGTKGGMTIAAYSIAFWILIWTEFKFFMMYIKRVLVVAFLTVISPLITITYSIDKAGDGQAQAFQGWFKEYLINILIQPLQAMLYLVFVYSASEIAIKAPVVGIIFLLSLTRAEKIVKEIFNMRNLSSISTMRLFKK